MGLRHTVILTVLFFSVSSTIAWGIPPRLFQQFIAQVSNEPLSFELGQIELIQVLNLTPAQHKQFEVAFNQNKERIKQNQQALQQAAFELQALIEGTETSNQIREKHSQLQKLQQQIENTNFETLLTMRELLTPEQRYKWSKLLQKQRKNLQN